MGRRKDRSGTLSVLRNISGILPPVSVRSIRDPGCTKLFRQSAISILPESSTLPVLLNIFCFRLHGFPSSCRWQIPSPMGSYGLSHRSMSGAVFFLTDGSTGKNGGISAGRKRIPDLQPSPSKPVPAASPEADLPGALSQRSVLKTRQMVCPSIYSVLFLHNDP